MNPSALNHRYRAEISRNDCDSPVLKLIPMNPNGPNASQRQVAASIYEIAAALERASDDLGVVSWAISPEPSDSKVTVELSRARQGGNAEDLIRDVLEQLNIPVAEVR